MRGMQGVNEPVQIEAEISMSQEGIDWQWSYWWISLALNTIKEQVVINEQYEFNDDGH